MTPRTTETGTRKGSGGQSPPSPSTIIVPPESAGQRLDVFLAGTVSEVSRSQLARHIAEGAVTVNGVTDPPSRKVRAGDVVVWTPPEVRPVALQAEEIPLRIAYEDEWLVVVDKAPGMVVHPAPGHEGGTLVNALLAACHDLRGVGGELRPGIVHRIDKDTSGLLVVAKDDRTMNALGAAFKVHDIHRVYEALVVGRPPEDSGRIETLHGRDPRDRKKFSIRVKSGRTAITRWRVLERLHGAARMEAELETGRTHQVRLHMASLGCPILGDPVYGRAPRDPELRELGVSLGRQALHARVLGFRHPATGSWLELTSPLPPDLESALARLRELAVRARESEP